MKHILCYFGTIEAGKMILWCYLIWYLVIVAFYYDDSPKIWLNALGISAVIGSGLRLSITAPPGDPGDHWQTLRLYLMPFCVSSFSTLTKDQGFLLFIPPHLPEMVTAIVCCLVFLLAIVAIKANGKPAI